MHNLVIEEKINHQYRKCCHRQTGKKQGITLHVLGCEIRQTNLDGFQLLFADQNLRKRELIPYVHEGQNNNR